MLLDGCYGHESDSADATSDPGLSVVTPSTRSWSEAELLTLANLASRSRGKTRSWKRIAAEIDGRTAIACKRRWGRLDLRRYRKSITALEKKPDGVSQPREPQLSARVLDTQEATPVSTKPTSQKGSGAVKLRKLRVGDPVRVASSTLRKRNAKLRDGVGKSLVGKIERCGAVANTWVTSFADIPGREFELRSNAVRRVHHPGPCGSAAETNWTEVELGTLANLGHQWAGVASQMPWTRIAAEIGGRTADACKQRWIRLDKRKYPKPTPEWRKRPLRVVFVNEGVVGLRFGREDPATGKVESTQLLMHSGHFSVRTWLAKGNERRVGIDTLHGEQIHVYPSRLVDGQLADCLRVIDINGYFGDGHLVDLSLDTGRPLQRRVLDHDTVYSYEIVRKYFGVRNL